MARLFANTPSSRRDNMRAVRSRGNRSTEVRLRGAMVRKGLRGWSLHSKEVLGAPDFFFRDCHVAIFVDGCFWHGCPRCGHIPKTNAGYWVEKIGRNVARDRKVARALVSDGVNVIRLWECEVRTALSDCVNRVAIEVARKRFQGKHRSAVTAKSTRAAPPGRRHPPRGRTV